MILTLASAGRQSKLRMTARVRGSPSAPRGLVAAPTAGGRDRVDLELPGTGLGVCVATPGAHREYGGRHPRPTCMNHARLLCRPVPPRMSQAAVALPQKTRTLPS